MVRRILSLWSGPWPLVKHLLVLIVAEIYAVMACSAPVYAFQITSTTGYSRVVSQAAQQAWASANKQQIAQAIASAAIAPSAGSIAVRAVTGPIGWAALGVAGALVIAGMLYDAAERQQVKDNASAAAGNPNIISVNGQSMAVGSGLNNGCGSPPTAGCQQLMDVLNGLSAQACGSTGGLSIIGWTYLGRSFGQAIPGGGPNVCKDRYQIFYNGSNGGNLATSAPAPPTQQQLADYVASLPSSNPLAPEQQIAPAGTTNPAPQGASSTTDIPVSPTQLPTTVKPSNNGAPGDSVVNPNEPAPQQTTQQQTQSATTTTTTNPDGSQTEQQTASVTCSGGQHNARSFGSVLQDHYNVWSASGLLGTLELLKNLSWPTTFPTYTLHSTVMGTFTFDFNAWSGVINALRALVIAGAGFVAYRIIFIGGH